MPSNDFLLNECGVKLSAMDAHLAAATERLGVGDITRAQVEVSAAHALLGPAGKALADVAKAVLAPAEPAPEPMTPGQPPMPMLPGQVAIEYLTEDDRLYLANESGVGPKVYGTQAQINRLINDYNQSGGFKFRAGFRVQDYTGPLKK
jgi:hypothetical protein